MISIEYLNDEEETVALLYSVWYSDAHKHSHLHSQLTLTIKALMQLAAGKVPCSKTSRQY